MFPVKKKPETDPENPQADQPEEEVYCEDQELEEGETSSVICRHLPPASISICKQLSIKNNFSRHDINNETPRLSRILL